MDRFLCIVVASILFFNIEAMEKKNVYVYDPAGIFEEAIVMREVNGLKHYLKSHPSNFDLVFSMSAKDKYDRSCIHYAALIEDEELYKIMLGLGADVSAVDCFGFSAEDYLKGRHK